MNSFLPLPRVGNLHYFFMKKRNSHYSEVVVAEKNFEYRSSLCSVVASLNWLPIPTSSGLETMSAIKQGQIALVLLDVDLTFTDGENTLHEIRKVAPNLPIIMMSGVMTPTLARRFTDRGAQGFLLKPVQRAHLAMMLFQYLPS
jgi:DNA-binding NtrC family response regulator